MQIIQVSELTVSRHNTYILDHVSFSVHKGDYIGIVGPNGSGKTTLIKTILGLIKPTSGNIKILGQSLPHFCDWQQVGYLPQVAGKSPKNFPATVAEVIATGLLAAKPFPRRFSTLDRKAVDQVLDLLEISDLSKRQIGMLSGGQKQRVLLGRALVGRPDILILDEPTTALDPITRDNFYRNLNRLNQEQGTTILLITHDSATIGKHAGKLLYLDRRLVFFGDFSEFCQSGKMTNYFGDFNQHLICHQHECTLPSAK